MRIDGSTTRTTPTTRAAPRAHSRAALLVPVGLALAIALGPLAAAAPAGRAAASVNEIRAVLARRTVEARTRVEVLAELTELGPAGIPDLFDVYTGRSLGELLGDKDARRGWWCSPEVFPELALEALAELPPARVVSHLAERTADARVATRVAALDVLAALRSASGLELWLRQAEALSAASREDPGVREALIGSLVAILEREPRALRSLEELVAGADETLLPLVATAAARTPGPATTAFLLALLGRGVAWDRAVLDGVVRRGTAFPWRLREDTRDAIRGLLTQPDPELRCAAASALERLDDVRAIPDLLALLDANDAGVRRSATRALRALSRRPGLDEDADWAGWYDSERAWWRDRGTALVAELERAAPGHRARIVRTLARHPLERARVASVLVEQLPHAEAAHAADLCRALAELGSSRAVPALVTLLYEPDAGTREAAYEALLTLTGRDLPLEPPIWSLLASGREP